MSRTNRFLSGVSLGYTSQLIVMLVGLWLTPFVLTRVGQHDYGLWLVAAQVLAYLALLDLGIVVLVPRETGLATGSPENLADAGHLSRLIGQTLRLVLWQMPVVIVAEIGLWLLWPERWDALRGPLALVFGTFTVIFPLRVFPAVLQGLQDLTFPAKVQTCGWLAGAALTAALVFAGFGLWALAIGWMASQLITTPVLVYRLRRHFPEAWPERLPALTWPVARTRLSSGLWVSVGQVAVVLLFGTDLLVIGSLLGAAAVVPYACTVKLGAVFANQPQLLMQLAMPGLSQLRAGGQSEPITRVCIALTQAMLWLSGAVVCVVLAGNEGFVRLWVGHAQYAGAWVTFLALLAMLLRHWNLTIGYILFAFGKERRLALTGLVDGLVTTALVAVLSWQFGLPGAAAGAVLGVCFVSLPANLFALAAMKEISVAAILQSLVPWLWRFGIVALAAWTWSRWFVPRNVASLAAVAILTFLTYLALMLPVAFHDPLGIYVRPRVMELKNRFWRAVKRQESPRT